MKLTARILVHELTEAFGPVEGGDAFAKRSFIGTRLGAFDSVSDDLVYVVDAADEETLASLANANANALIISVGAQAKVGPASMALRRECDCREVHSFLLEVFLRYGLWTQSMDESLIKGEGIQALLDLSEPILENTVVVVDSSLKLLAYTKGIACADVVTNELIKNGYHTEEIVRKFRLSQRFEVWAKHSGFIVNDTRTISNEVVAAYSFKSSGSFSLVVVMVCSKTELSPWLLDVLSILIERIAYYSNRDYSDDTPSGVSFSVFMRDLLAGTSLPREVVRKRAVYLGIPEKNAYCLFAFDASGHKLTSSVILSELSRAVAPAKIMRFGDYVVVLCFNCSREYTCSIRQCVSSGHGCAYSFGRSCSDICESMAFRLGKVLANYGITAGQSSKFYDIVHVPAAFSQAIAALSSQWVQDAPSPESRGPRSEGKPSAQASSERGAGQLGGAEEIEALEHVVSFDASYMRYVARCVDERRPGLIASLPAVRMLTRIQSDDAANRTDNLFFLKAYLECERRASVAASVVGMHRNSIAYRIKTLEETYHFSVEDPSVRFDILTAYHLLGC